MISLPKKIAQYAFLIIFSLFSIFPLIWMVIAATNKSIDVIRGKMVPGTYLIENYKALVSQSDLWHAMGNSFKYSIMVTLLSLIVCSLAGYGFEIYHDKYKDALMGVILLAMMVPFVATMIPLFGMMAKFGLLNSVAGFVLPSISTPFLIMLFRQSARSFPHDIIEAARMDGLGEFQIFVRMFFPTMRSTYAAAMTITFITDDADAGSESDFRICDRLRYADVSSIILYTADRYHLLLSAEELRRGYHRCSKVSTVQFWNM